MVKAVIFDLDGTLVDTMDDLGTAMNRMLVRLGYDKRTKGELIRFINNGARNFVRLSLPEELQSVEFVVDSALSTYEAEYSQCYLEQSESYEGMKEALWGLSDRKIKLGVLSNKQDKFVKKIVEKIFGKKLFKFVQGNLDSLPKKPDPQGALYVAKQLGVKPECCVFVGDSDIDIETAKNAKMTSVAVSWGYRAEQVLKDAGADYIVHDTGELIYAIEKIFYDMLPEKKKKKQAPPMGANLIKPEKSKAQEEPSEPVEKEPAPAPVADEAPKEQPQEEKPKQRKNVVVPITSKNSNKKGS